jgi:hypothetical protein
VSFLESTVFMRLSRSDHVRWNDDACDFQCQHVQKFQNAWKLLYEVWKGFCSAATLALQLGTRYVVTRCVLPMVLTET